MPRFGKGSPNASIYPKMRPVLSAVSYAKYFEDEDDDVSFAAAVNEADDDANEEKKRSATEDDNPGASKKSKAKADGEGEQIPAAAALPGLPDLVLSMKQDENYFRIMNEAFKKMDGAEYNVTVEEEMAREILQKLQRDYHLLDTNGDSADDNVALHKIRMCLRRNKHKYKPRKPRQQSQPGRLLNIILDMKKDENYDRIMTDAFRELDGEEYDGTVEEMGDRVLQALKQKYHLVDRSGEPIDDEAALQKLVQCLTNQHHKSRRSEHQQPQSSNVTAPPSVATTATLDSLIAGSDVILDKRKDKTYRDTMNKFFNDYANKEYNDIAETGKAILLELQRSLGTEGRFRKRAGNGFVEVDSETALQMILQSLANKSQNPPLGNSATPQNPPLGNSAPSLHHTRSRTQDNSGDEQSRGPSVQTPTRDNLTEAERVNLLEFFGRSVVVNYLQKNASCGWNFLQREGITGAEEWIAVKDGFTENNAQEGVTMLTGLRKIANWAFREGHFETYANDAFGRNMLERKRLSAESYKIIFDRESEAEERSGAISRRSISPNSSPNENEDEGSNTNTTCQLRGKERDEWMTVYTDVILKLASADAADDANGKEFYGLLKECLETKMMKTQQWNDKKGILEKSLKNFEDVVRAAAAINQKTNNSFVRDTIIPSVIEEAKEKLRGA